MEIISYKYIQKLLDISSNVIEIKNEICTIENANIMELIKSRNSFYAFKNALHVFGSKEQQKVNNLIKKGNLYKTEYLYFAEDLFGNLFCKKNAKYYLMDIERGYYEYLSDSFDGWAKSILNDYNYLTGYPLADEWQNVNLLLKNDERLVPKIFFVLGGQYVIDNLYALDRIDALSLRADIFKQLRDIPDGGYYSFRNDIKPFLI